MNAELRSLISLQEIDLRISELNRRAAEIPAQIASREAKLSQLEKEIIQARERVAALVRERKKLEGEAELLRARLSKYKDQLMEVKTNREYQAMLKEIETCKEEIDKTEDKILELMLEGDEAEKSVREKEARLRQEREEVELERRALEAQARAMGSEIEELKAKKGETERGISAELLDLYRRLVRVRKGLALAEARNESCQACHVRLRPQVYSDVKKNDLIITCENCDRILYWKGDSA